jgi:predicted DNA-binding transcriptional regulator YafY
MWGQLYHEAAQGVIAKLENVLPDEQRKEISWAQRSLAATGLNRADIEMLAPTLEKLRRAVRENRRVGMTYHSGSNPHGEQRELDPYALIHRWGWWFVAGYCHLRREVRTFRVDRISELNLTAQPFSAPADFDLQAYLAQEWLDTPEYTVRMRFTPETAHLAHYGRGYWESFEEQPDGSIDVSFPAADMHTAVSNVLAYGPAVTVLHPPEVQQKVSEWAQAITTLYTAPKN